MRLGELLHIEMQVGYSGEKKAERVAGGHDRHQRIGVDGGLSVGFETSFRYGFCWLSEAASSRWLTVAISETLAPTALLSQRENTYILPPVREEASLAEVSIGRTR